MSHPCKVRVSSAFPLEGGRWGWGLRLDMKRSTPFLAFPLPRGKELDCLLRAPAILCRSRSPKTIAGQTREILCLSVSCHASTPVNDRLRVVRGSRVRPSYLDNLMNPSCGDGTPLQTIRRRRRLLRSPSPNPPSGRGSLRWVSNDYAGLPGNAADVPLALRSP